MGMKTIVGQGEEDRPGQGRPPHRGGLCAAQGRHFAWMQELVQNRAVSTQSICSLTQRVMENCCRETVPIRVCWQLCRFSSVFTLDFIDQ